MFRKTLELPSKIEPFSVKIWQKLNHSLLKFDKRSCDSSIEVQLYISYLFNLQRCVEDPLVAFCCCLLFGRIVVSLTYSPFPFSILLVLTYLVDLSGPFQIHRTLLWAYTTVPIQWLDIPNYWEFFFLCRRIV